MKSVKILEMYCENCSKKLGGYGITLIELKFDQTHWFCKECAKSYVMEGEK